MADSNQSIPVQNVRKIPKQTTLAHTEVKPKSFEQKSKETIIFLGDNWGYGTILIFIVVGVFGRRHAIAFFTNPRQYLIDVLTKGVKPIDEHKKRRAK
jgi:hypothetical protein